MLLNSCREWRLLCALKASLAGKMARYKPDRQNASATNNIAELSYRNDLAFIEAELLLVLRWEPPDTKLPQSTFDELRRRLGSLFERLEDCVNRDLTRDGGAPQSASGAYPNLKALLNYVDASPQGQFTLLSGPGLYLFYFTSPTDAKETLDVLGTLNEFMMGLCRESSHSYQPWVDASDRSEIPNTQFRDRAKKILDTIFRHLHCEANHDILLQLSDALVLDKIQESLELFLSRCARPDVWHEVQCLPYEDDFEINKIESMCLYLQAYSIDGMLLALLVEHQGIFSIRELPPNTSHLKGSLPQPLGGFIDCGALERVDSKNFEHISTNDVFTARQKKMIALRLGRCFMEFFDTEFATKTWNLGRIFLVSPPGSKATDGLWYVAFSKSRGVSDPPEFNIYAPGPTLLSFAQLLLEIEEGKRISVEPGMENWPRLLLRAAESERAGCGLYTEAVKGCLYFHVYLAMQLESKSGEDDVDINKAVRTIIYQRIVKPLENAVDPPTRMSKKRRRDDPHPSDSEGRNPHHVMKRRYHISHSLKGHYPQVFGGVSLNPREQGGRKEKSVLHSIPIERTTTKTTFFHRENCGSHFSSLFSVPSGYRSDNLAETDSQDFPPEHSGEPCTNASEERELEASTPVTEPALPNHYYPPHFTAPYELPIMSRITNDYDSSQATRSAELHQVTLFDEARDSGPDSFAEESKAFWEWMEKFNSIHIHPLVQADAVSRKIRIAVLDTGVSKKDPFIRGSARRIVGGRSWVGMNHQDYDDTYGHGTHVTRFLLQAAPAAEVFIAKISNDKYIDEKDVGRIAEAIIWAIAEWEVDIITLSLGLEEDNALIDKAIEVCLHPPPGSGSKKIVFAAAANWGGNAERAYPARRDGVICVHATDGKGNPGRFNPDAVQDGDNFATLGVSVHSRWAGNDVWKSGTSFAAPIAAGIAANILEFASHHLHDLSDDDRRWLYSSRGMRAVFRRMASRRGDYDYVRPWKLWQTQDGRKECTDEDIITILRKIIRYN